MIILLVWIIQPAIARPTAAFYDDPVTLNGLPVDYFTFSLHTRGVIGLRESNMVTEHQRHIPFQLYLRRNGTIIRQIGSNETVEVYAVKLDDIMPFARYGDELVLMPVRPSDQRSKRVIKLAAYNLFVRNFRSGC
ncbi:MAG: hypothetical protein JWP57_3025 [Spirosoma sp.]|nr:hypothetical protein [Spirosoma sp.]